VIVGSNPTGGLDVCVLSGRGLCDELITRPEGPTDCGVSCVIKKPRERGGHSVRWAAEPEKIVNNRCMGVARINYGAFHYLFFRVIGTYFLYHSFTQSRLHFITSYTKSKVRHITGLEGLEGEYRYSSTLS
jgi:hypothetical protein